MFEQAFSELTICIDASLGKAIHAFLNLSIILPTMYDVLQMIVQDNFFWDDSYWELPVFRRRHFGARA